MNNDIDNLFKNLENEFDIETPNLGHKERFLSKLNNKGGENKKVQTIFKMRKLLFGVAASIILLLSVFIFINQPDASRDLANVSPEMAETQSFFVLTVNEELSKLENESSPEVQKIKQDALIQIKILEENYAKLKKDLLESGDDSRVIYAMISNFQNRIDILQNTLTEIENIKQLKQSSNETSSTI